MNNGDKVVTPQGVGVVTGIVSARDMFGEPTDFIYVAVGDDCVAYVFRAQEVVLT